jgi:CubicO group peptidase (beta-lactamase class C family)
MTILTHTGCSSPRKNRRRLRCFTVLLLLSTATARAESSPPKQGPQTIAALQQQIEKIVRDTQTPGAGIALVGREGPIWVAGLGLADVAQNRPATGDTLFRIGSTSKMFVALSVLKLQEEGRLNLQDTLRSRAPEVAFANPWETTDPIRIVHLLEHTTGWDDKAVPNAMRDVAENPMPEPTHREGLASFPGAPTSRWRPGTSFSYANLGPAVAAYVVEKITGERFEDYVARTWFKPLGMVGASYFDRPATLANLATGYRPGGQPTFLDWKNFMRPAGSIEASPRDMANFVEFYLGRGTFRGSELLPGSAIDRMERPTTTYAAVEGLTLGYGLGNSVNVWRNWEFHGHGGALPGALADLAYLPAEGVGYAVMINCENGGAMAQLENAIRAYLVRDLKPPPPPPAPVGLDETQIAEYAGWYEPITPRNERSRYLESLLGMTHLSFGSGQLFLHDLTNGKVAYVRTDGRRYRRVSNTRWLALVGNHADGTLFQTAGGPTFRRMSASVSDLKLGFAVTTVFLMGSSAILAFGWLARRFFGDLKGAPFIGVRTDPLLATLFGTAVFILIWEASGDYYSRSGGPLWSGHWVLIANYLTLGAFTFFAIRGLSRALRRYRGPIHWTIWWHCFVTSLVLTVWAVYLSCWGLYGEFAS